MGEEDVMRMIASTFVTPASSRGPAFSLLPEAAGPRIKSGVTECVW